MAEEVLQLRPQPWWKRALSWVRGRQIVAHPHERG
jgi:hypothetical protein